MTIGTVSGGIRELAGLISAYVDAEHGGPNDCRGIRRCGGGRHG